VRRRSELTAVLGRFLEFSLATPDIQASLDFYTRLGFSQAEVGEAWTHPYAVVTDGRICLGLHQASHPGAAMTFVNPDLLKHWTHSKAGVEFEFRRLGNDVFNEVGWFDPSGQLIRLIEARTFSPSKRLEVDTSHCGYFLEIALPTPDSEAAKTYWEQFGFVGIDELDDRLPHVSCTSDYHRSRSVRARAFAPLHACGSKSTTSAEPWRGWLAKSACRRRRDPPPLRQLPAAVWMAPEGHPFCCRRRHSPGVSAASPPAALSALRIGDDLEFDGHRVLHLQCAQHQAVRGESQGRLAQFQRPAARQSCRPSTSSVKGTSTVDSCPATLMSPCAVIGRHRPDRQCSRTASVIDGKLAGIEHAGLSMCCKVPALASSGTSAAKSAPSSRRAWAVVHHETRAGTVSQNPMRCGGHFGGAAQRTIDHDVVVPESRHGHRLGTPERAVRIALDRCDRSCREQRRAAGQGRSSGTRLRPAAALMRGAAGQ
jgi:catechol 2,3-dioxygenase-like lactoylglutathione lyase family enzyme